MKSIIVATVILVLATACSTSPDGTVSPDLSDGTLTEQEFRQYVRDESAANLLGAAIGCEFLKGLDTEEAARWISSGNEAQQRVTDDPDGQKAAEIIIEECRRLGFLD